MVAAPIPAELALIGMPARQIRLPVEQSQAREPTAERVVVGLARERMSRNTSITLGEHFARFVDAEIASGRYAAAAVDVAVGPAHSEPRNAALAVLPEASHSLMISKMIVVA